MSYQIFQNLYVKKEYSINDTEKIASMLSSIPHLQDKEDVSIDVESVFTNISVEK